MSKTAEEEEVILPEDQEVEDVEIDLLDKEEEEEENTEEEEKEEEEEDKTDDKGHLIPKYRYDSATQRARDAEAEVLRLRTEMEQKTSTESEKPKDDPFADLDMKHSQAIADGDLELAATINAQARALMQEQMREEMSQTASSAQAAAAEQIRVDATINALNAQFPVLDPDSDTYSQEHVDEVLNLQNAFILSGKPAAQALAEAAKYVFPSSTVVEDKTPAVKPKVTDIATNIDTANRQPPSLSDVGQDSNSSGKLENHPDPTQLSEEEFDALPEATKKRMRGDSN